jgi:molybdate transport system substrate-binding protein
MELHILSAGAVKGLVTALAPKLLQETGATIEGEFGPVGAMRERLLAGSPCDIVILTSAMQDALAAEGRVRGESIAALGAVRTGIAVRDDETLPAIADRDSLRRTLAGAQGLYLPDPERSTAGIHFAHVLRTLGIHDTVSPRMHAFPSGAEAMSELAKARGPGLVGCTQITEIAYTPGVALVGPLPEEFDLATVYAVAVCVDARAPDVARRFAQILAGPESRTMRRRVGFET